MFFTIRLVELAVRYFDLNPFIARANLALLLFLFLLYWHR